jgi:zinc protease
MTRFLTSILSTLFITAATLVPELSSAEPDKNLTVTEKLRNDISLISRETPGSDIVTLSVTFMTGSADESFNKRAINELAMEAMTYSTKKFSKAKIFGLTEKYSIGLACRGGIEMSQCSIQTVNEYLPQAIDLLASVVTEPSFNKDDVTLAKQQRVADYQRAIQNPESHANTTVNTVFYDLHHPYRLLPQDGIKQTDSLTVDDLKTYHRSLLDASKIFITYAGPKMNSKIRKHIMSKFERISKLNSPKKIVAAPLFEPKNSIAFEHRQIPTAYIRVKFNAPSILAKDAAAADIMFEILSQKLQEEIRTKRSLSYAVYAGTLQYNQGIGVLSVSTSKPKETLEAMAAVVKSFRERGVTQEELNEYRNIFTTSYFLTLESHGSLAGALSSFQFYFGDAKKLYDLPEKLSAVTPADIQRIAKDVLKNFRIGVVYDKEKFETKWLDVLTKV